LREDELLSRAKVVSLMHQKLKEKGMKPDIKDNLNGVKEKPYAILNKETAKLFNVEENYKINFQHFHTFLKMIYDSDKTSVNLNI